MIGYGLLWFVGICYDWLWVRLTHNGALWESLIRCDSSCFAMVHNGKDNICNFVRQRPRYWKSSQPVTNSVFWLECSASKTEFYSANEWPSCEYHVRHICEFDPWCFSSDFTTTATTLCSIMSNRWPFSNHVLMDSNIPGDAICSSPFFDLDSYQGDDSIAEHYESIFLYKPEWPP